MSLDRRVALGCWLLAAVVITVTTVVSDPPVVPVEHDEAAFADLLDHLAASVDGDWLVEFESVRTDTEGRELAGIVTEIRHDPYHVELGAEDATIDNGRDAYQCVVLEEGLQCLPVERGEPLPAHEVLRVAVEDTGAYVVTRARGQRIAGESGQCFRVFAAKGYLADLGAETRYCFSEDGIPLWTRTVGPLGTAERRARLVEREPTTAQVEELLQGLETIAAEPED